MEARRPGVTARQVAMLTAPMTFTECDRKMRAALTLVRLSYSANICESVDSLKAFQAAMQAL